MIHATFRGIVGAMAMTGIRMFAQHLGLIREDPRRGWPASRPRGC